MSKFNIKIANAPPIYELEQKSFNNSINDLDIEDLLNRPEIKFNANPLKTFFKNETILVTGSGGSIGSKICHELVNLNVNNLILLDNSEFNLYSIKNQLDKYKNINSKNIIPILGSIMDKKRLEQVLKNGNQALFFIQALYKHVPIVEHNVVEGINNNVYGTLNLVTLSEKFKVKNLF